MITDRLMFTRTMVGITDASATNRPSIPCTAPAASTTEPESGTDPVVLAPELRRGIDENELSMVYQPIVALADLTTVRYEALLRWRNPRRGRRSRI